MGEDEYIIELEKEIKELKEEKDKYQKRCSQSLKLIRKNYGILDKYGINMIDDILSGLDDELI